jgi:hypothetical protein
MNSEVLPIEFQKLYEAGDSLGNDIERHLEDWPSKGSGYVRGADLPDNVSIRIEELRDEAHRWFNEITIQVATANHL